MLSFRQQNILVWVTKKQSCYKKTFKDSVFFSCNSDMWYILSFKILLFLLVSPPIYLFKSLATTKELILFLFLMFPSKKTKEDFQRCHIQLQSCINSSQREDFSAKNLLCALIKSQYFAFPPLCFPTFWLCCEKNEEEFPWTHWCASQALADLIF